MEKAKAATAEAGYKDGFSFKLSVRNVSPAIDIAQAVQQSMSAAGIKMEILQTDQKQFITAYRGRQFEAALGTSGAGLPRSARQCRDLCAQHRQRPGCEHEDGRPGATAGRTT